ncbi:MAG: MoaD/ThiS family protein [Nitrososphaerota archaeon]|nr:MoaD/ThiS family protein [Nitrososphaerota archaeon]
MITVRCLGHIGTALGARELTVPDDDIDAADLVEKLRAASGKGDPGFTKFNTLVMVEDGEAFVPAGESRRLKDGARVVLIPFSHGG